MMKQSSKNQNPPQKWHAMSAAETLSSLGANPDKGLSEKNASLSRLRGANVITEKKPIPLYERILSQLTEPMMAILFVALLLTVTVNAVTAIKGGAFDFTEIVGILCSIIISVTVSLVMEGKSAKAFRMLTGKAKSVRVKTLRDGNPRMIPSEELVVGDIVFLETGDRIAADMRIIESRELKTDEAPLTGESGQASKTSEKLPLLTPLAERKNMAYSGCFVTSGSGMGVVTEVGDDTEIGKVAGAIAEGADFSPLGEKLSRLGKIITIAGLIVAATVFAVRLYRLTRIGTPTFEGVSDLLLTSIVLIVATVPEGLPTVVAVSLALGVVKLSKVGALVKRMSACETIGSVSVICSDKTGTLTENKMTVTELIVVGDRAEMLKNFAVNTTADLEYSGKTIAFCGSPTECALLVKYDLECGDYRKTRRATPAKTRFPFSSELKRMTTVAGDTAYLKGAPETVLSLCGIVGRAAVLHLKRIESYQRGTNRVIAFAHGAAAYGDRDRVESGLTLDGFAVISDPIRREVYAAAEEARRAKIAVVMLTGDNLATATAVAKALKIPCENPFTGEEIDAMREDELLKKVRGISLVARSTPTTKSRIVSALKKLGEVVAVTGDGINDAPAIKTADVGIAMGITGTQVTKEASDIILLDDSFATVIKAVRHGRGIYENFRRFITFQLTVNLAAVLTVTLSVLLGFPPPFSPLQLLWINLIMDGPPALTLGLEKISSDIMSRNPVRRDAPIVSKKMLLRILLSGGYMAAIMIAQTKWNFLGISGGAGKERTALFTIFVLLQLFNAICARELGLKSVFCGFFQNKALLAVVSATLLLQVLIAEKGGAFFNTCPLSVTDWAKVLAVSLSIIAFTEIAKLAVKISKDLVYEKKERPNHLGRPEKNCD